MKQLFNALKRNRNVFNLLRCKVERVLEAVSGFTNRFCSSFEDNELYFLSFGVPAKPGIAKDLIEADYIGRKAVADFIDSLLVKKICLSQRLKMLQANKVLRLARPSKKKLPNLQNANSQVRAQHVHLAHPPARRKNSCTQNKKNSKTLKIFFFLVRGVGLVHLI